MKDKLRKLIREAIELDINVGDEILAGRFKNKKVIVKSIGKDDKNQPTINGKTILKFRIKKLIKEELDKLFEVLDFPTTAVEQMAMNMSLFKLPRKGMDDSINNYNLVQACLDKEDSPEEKEEEVIDKFNSPAINSGGATVSTNIYEAKEIEESYGIYGSTQAAQQNLDSDGGVPPKTASFTKDAQEEFDLHNNNIDRELKEIPAGDSREGGVSNNKSKNF